jgi:hypothetical protein
MNSKKLILVILFLVVSITLVMGQDVSSAGDPNPNEIGVDSAQQKLKEVSISKFEDAGFWYPAMAMDQGIAKLRRFEGGPADKEPIPEEAELGISEEDNYVLGMKVMYFFRGDKTFAIYPVRPLPIEGICKTVSVWVVGRNFNHTLKLIVSDYFGNRAEITMGKLNFSGWKKMTVAIPPHLKQRDFHHSGKIGIKVLGFKIETDPAESYGTYYIYFDDLRAVTDLYPEEARDPDDMVDAW